MQDDAFDVQQVASALGNQQLTASTPWAARSMADWRERGYVPDSDDEDEVGFGSGPIADDLPKVLVEPLLPKESKPSVCINEITQDAGPENPGDTIPASSRNASPLQEVENISAEERKSGAGEEWHHFCSYDRTGTGESKEESRMGKVLESDFAETVEVAEALPTASVGDQLQAELEYGLKSVRDILGDAYTKSGQTPVSRSQTSSPLSSIRSFTDDDETATAAVQSRLEPGEAEQGVQDGQLSRDPQDDLSPRYSGRDLRRRNPIQLHPYALEDARYQQELKAHGLKPVRVAFDSSGLARDKATEDSQDQDLFSSSPIDESAEAESLENLDSILRSQDAPPPEASRKVSAPRPQTLFDADEELPELSAILEGDVPHLHTRKRRKITHTQKWADKPSQSLSHNDFYVPELPPADLDRPVRRNIDTDMLEMPPSPPRSSSSNVSGRLMVPNKMSGANERTTPRGLPTPAASSLIKAPLEPGVETGYSSDASEGSELDHNSVAGSSPPSADMRQGNGIQTMRRRIKGVLPASWLTLDLDKQTAKTRPRRSSGGSPVKKPGAKGVAQRVKSSRRRLSLVEGKDVPVIDISDDSSVETNPPLLAEASSTWASNLFEDDDFGGMLLDDVVEDNAVDAMAPPLIRCGKREQMPPGRQRTLHETFNTLGASQPGHSGVLQPSYHWQKQSTPSGKAQRHRKHRHGKPALTSRQRGILDAPAFDQLRVDSQPQFLRVAARRTRTQKDKGRNGQRQAIPLTSQANRHNVNPVPLDPGETGFRSQRNEVSALGRIAIPPPFADHHMSPQTSDIAKASTKPTSAHSPDELAALKSSTASTIHRLLLRKVGTTASTSSDRSTNALEVSSVRAGPPSRPVLPRRLFSQYQNRSGKGRLSSSLAPVRAPRLAQLEDSQPRASRSHLVPPENPSITSGTTASTPQVFTYALPQRPRGRKRAPQHRENRRQGSAAAGDSSTAELGKGDSMDLRPGTFFRDLTFAGYDDLVRIIRKVRETGYKPTDYVNLVQLLRTYYGNNNMDEPFAERSSDTREFLENHRAPTIIQVPTNNDLGFDAFLKLVIITGLQKARSGEKPSSLSNFIFSLIPNSGQLLRKDQHLDSWALRPVQNRHDLYSALYFIAPVETKIRLLPQISGLVDLRESHISACTISLQTLVRLVRFQISIDEDPYVLYHFGKLFQEMVKKMEEQFDAARLEALTQLGGILSRRESLCRIMRFNQDKIQSFLVSILQAWSNCIRDCRTADQARYLLFGDGLGALLGLCHRTLTSDTTNDLDGRDALAFRDEVIETILSTVTSYILNWLLAANNGKDFVDDLHIPLKNLLSTQLGRHEQCSDEILRSLTFCWHALAKASVHHGVRSWDSYLSLGGRDAWQSFDDTWHKRRCEIYFAARFIEFNQNAWSEWQVPMLDLWMRSLLVPEAHFQYQADLTTQIMSYGASWNSLLFHLPLATRRERHYVHVQLDDLAAARTALVLALVRNMNNAMTNPDSQDSFFFGSMGPSEDDYSAVLKNMMAAMKQYLSELEGKPAEQTVYGDFVAIVLSKMRLCTNHLEPVPDDFEYAPGKFLPLTPDIIKAKLGLYRQQMAEGGMEKRMVVFLHTAAERAAITGQQDAFEKQLVDVFLDLTPEALEDGQGYAADARFRTLFFQNAFPAYLDRVFYGSGFILARPVLGCVRSVYNGLRFRFGFWAQEYVEPFLTATLSLLATLKSTLGGSITSPERILTDASQLGAYTWLCSIVCEMLSRCQEMEDSFGPCDALAAIWEYFLFFYQFTLKVAFRPPRALPEALRDEDDDTLLSGPKLSAADDAMLTYSKRELGDILDFKWVPGYGGTWYVKRAGGRKERVDAGGLVGSLEQETSRMQAAAERYVEGFARLWQAQ